MFAWLAVALHAALTASHGVDPEHVEIGSSAAVARGRAALLGSSFLGPAWSREAYEGLGAHLGAAWPDPAADPEGYRRAVAERFGLHAPSYPNGGLPMGLRPAGPAGGVQVDCLLCHGGSIGGTSVVGLGNTQLDAERVFRELTAADGIRQPPVLFTVNTARGTVNAGQMSAVLLAMRNRDLSVRRFPLPLASKFSELDTPAWWLLKKKKTMYYDGRTDARSVRTLMQFMLAELTREEFEALEPTFRDIRAFLLSLEPPRYPFEIDGGRSERGRVVFERECARCHGTYGAEPTYPSRVVELDVIGTDPVRALAPSKALIDHYNGSWFGAEYPAAGEMVGYQAPPLDGIWATAPYLHNGSVPTLAHLLDSGSRPDRFLRPASTGFEHYDRERVGWRAEEIAACEGPPPGSEEARRYFDSTRFGLDNGGHGFGDGIAPDERRDLIEYLKSL